MPAYEYRCRTCGSSFDVRRGIDEPASRARCPSGHDDTARVYSVIAVGGRSKIAPAPAAVAGSGCCGGGCCG